MEENRYLIEFYNNYNEEERLLSKYGKIEFLTTLHYIEKYIKSNDKIIEIGAGTGRYSHFLARGGYRVDAVELVEHNIEIFKKNTLVEEKVSVVQGNALDLSFIEDNKYDITLVLGPLYHLYSEEDKKQALREAIRVTKKGGKIFVAYVISDGCLIDEGFSRGNIDVRDYIKRGLIDGETFVAKSKPEDLFELVRKEDIDRLTLDFPVKRLHYVASDGCALLIRDAIEKMSDEIFELYFKYHLTVCEREDLLGITSHALDILEKI
ncbi:bifunctional 2-polyprenyl-6-hydroxyphenol methylase/3-demethylubiquinol 3-O-methyltransferase UbiG [uncultured Fusobacterium sp.]|jgi:SAM-dependent methyltransferase|uniref:class I SAM-dependent methyltransferase n=1 Tax=uncultured Fusobacterium sp. TaxID=159267 RepID=UPI0015A52C78|nr:class I SAM-dependent methyltransferase [uncultured Fusobacterium sp.]